MADIELVVKIPESKLWSLKNEPIKENFNIYELASYIDKGTPLPKGHGRLFDEQDIVNGNYEIIGNRIYELEPIVEAESEE